MPEETEGKKTDVKKEKFGDLQATSSEVPEASSSHKKKKKSKKHKHETDVVAEKILEEAGVNSAKDGNGIPTAVSDEKILDIPPTSNEVPEESSRKKKKKSRKEEHQIPEEAAGKKTDANAVEGVNETHMAVNDEQIGQMPAIGCEIPGDLSNRKRNKKSKKNKHDTDVVAEKILEEPQGKKADVNSVKDGNGIPTAVSDEKIVGIPPTSNEVPEESSHNKKKKSRKDEHQITKEAEGKKTDVNAVEGGNNTHMAVNDEKTGQMLASSSEISGDLSNRKRNKKSKKNKHETDVVAEKILEEPQGKKADVNFVKDGYGIPTAVSDGKVVDIPPTSNEVPEESSHKKKKKSRKDEHQIPEEAEGKKTDANAAVGVNDTHMVVNDEKTGQMAASSSEISGDLSNRKRNKKSKKNKHVTDLLTETMPEEAKTKKTDVNVAQDRDDIHTAVIDKKITDMPAASSDALEEQSSRQKKLKSKNDEHKMPEGAVVKDVAVDPGESNSHKKKKSKKHKHESDLLSDEGEMLEKGKKIDVIAVKDGNSSRTTANDEKVCNDEKKEIKDKRSDMSDSCVDVSPVPDCPSTSKKAKKRKHGIDEEREAEGEKLEVCVGVENKKNALVLTGSDEVTEEPSSHEKIKKAKKHKRENDLPAEKLLEVTKGRKRDTNISGDTDGIGESGRRTESKEARKQNSDTGIPDEKGTEGTEREVKELDTVVKDKGAAVPTDDNEVTGESSSHRKKKKAKKRKQESEFTDKKQECNDGKKEDKNNTAVQETCAEASQESSSHTKCKVATKRKHESEKMVEEQKGEKTEKSEDMPACSSDVAGESSGHKKKKKAKKHKHERGLGEKGNNVLESDYYCV